MNRVGLFDRTSLAAIRKLLDIGAARQKVHAANLANAGAAGYVRKGVRFSDELARTGAVSLPLAGTDERHLGAGKVEERKVEFFDEPAEDGSDAVDTEEEVVALAANQLRFNMAARLATLKIAALRASIQGRS